MLVILVVVFSKELEVLSNRSNEVESTTDVVLKHRAIIFISTLLPLHDDFFNGMAKLWAYKLLLKN